MLDALFCTYIFAKGYLRTLQCCLAAIADLLVFIRVLQSNKDPSLLRKHSGT